MTLEDLVPPLEDCKRIPEGEFGESALVWVTAFGANNPRQTGDLFKGCTIWERDEGRLGEYFVGQDESFPAPTLAEILKEMDLIKGAYPFAESYNQSLALWRVRAFVPGELLSEYDTNPATAALRLWLKIKGVDHD